MNYLKAMPTIPPPIEDVMVATADLGRVKQNQDYEMNPFTQNNKFTRGLYSTTAYIYL